jgi:hypothetical protein
MAPRLVECKRCEKHGTPITAAEWNALHGNPEAGHVLHTIVRSNGEKEQRVRVCEFCGWKMTA